MADCICGHPKYLHTNVGCFGNGGECACRRWKKPTPLKELLKQVAPKVKG